MCQLMDSGLNEAGGAQANPRTDLDHDGEEARNSFRDNVDSSQENLLSITLQSPYQERTHVLKDKCPKVSETTVVKELCKITP